MLNKKSLKGLNKVLFLFIYYMYNKIKEVIK